MSESLQFLPWIRRGLLQHVARNEKFSNQSDGTVMPAEYEPAFDLEAELEINKTLKTTKKFALSGPGAILGINPQQILRTEPQDGTTDFEPNYFPYVDLKLPDLPWIYSLAGADSKQGRLRPWIALVTVTLGDGNKLDSQQPLPVLTVNDPASELPNLNESFAWAHVQSTVPHGQLSAAVESGSTSVAARLICPRKLKANRSYLACIVPAFEPGRLIGLGEEPITAMKPAWTGSEASVRLPVYFSWRFSTGPRGDFESLCRKLKPDYSDAIVGVHTMDISDPGMQIARHRPNSKWKTPVRVDFRGALASPELSPKPWNAKHKADFQRDLTTVLNTGAGRQEIPADIGDYDPMRDDPVVTPPFYGSRHTNCDTVPARGWIRQLNLTPIDRAAAGLGAEVVRRNQEPFMAAIWQQAGELRQALQSLNQASLAAEMNRSLTKQVNRINPELRVQLTRPLHTWLEGDSGKTIQQSVYESAIPAQLVSSPFLRLTRTASGLSKNWSNLDQPRPLTADVTRAAINGTGANATATERKALAYAIFPGPSGTQLRDETLNDDLDRPPSGFNSEQTVKTYQNTQNQTGALLYSRDSLNTLSEYASKKIASTSVKAKSKIVGGNKPAGSKAVSPPSLIPAKPMVSIEIGGADVSGIGNDITRALKSDRFVHQNLTARIPGLARIDAEESFARRIPAAVKIGPVVESPLFPYLKEIDPEFVLPGARDIPKNSVKLVEVNNDFVAAFMVGANHEFSRELLWREFPSDLGATFFHRFWLRLDSSGNMSDPEKDLVTDIHTWSRNLSLGKTISGSAASNSAVVVIRGDLIRRYPDVQIYLMGAKGTGESRKPDETDISLPIFFGGFSRGMVFYGFDKSVDAIRGSRSDPGYYFVFEEQPTAPRFGLDVARKSDFQSAPRQWSDLSWGHLATDEAHLAAISHASLAPIPRLDPKNPPQGAIWGFNSAHMASITYQKPFRMLIHGETLL